MDRTILIEYRESHHSNLIFVRVNSSIVRELLTKQGSESFIRFLSGNHFEFIIVDLLLIIIIIDRDIKV